MVLPLVTQQQHVRARAFEHPSDMSNHQLWVGVTSWSHWRTLRRHFSLLSITSLLIVVTGCEAIGYIGHVFFPQMIKARHHLTDVATLVMVDDPSNLLGDRTMSVHIANHVGFHLTENRVLTQPHLVPPDHLYALADQLADQYARTPIDRIGKALNAAQVLHVYVVSAGLESEPGLIRPTAVLQVKVIDVLQGKRLYPPGLSVSDPEAQETHYDDGRVTIKMRHQSTGDNSPYTLHPVREKLAERAGRDVARLFFDHLPRQPGETFDD